MHARLHARTLQSLIPGVRSRRKESHARHSPRPPSLFHRNRQKRSCPVKTKLTSRRGQGRPARLAGMWGANNTKTQNLFLSNAVLERVLLSGRPPGVALHLCNEQHRPPVCHPRVSHKLDPRWSAACLVRIFLVSCAHCMLVCVQQSPTGDGQACISTSDHCAVHTVDTNLGHACRHTHRPNPYQLVPNVSPQDTPRTESLPLHRTRQSNGGPGARRCRGRMGYL
jgi:hypothetical protein